LQIGIPIFFYISGVGASHYNCEKHSFLSFLGSRVMRLLVPLLVAIPLFLMPRLYLTQAFEDTAQLEGGVIDNYWAYCIALLPHIASKLSWLWFLPMLFSVTIFCYPLMAWTQRRRNERELDSADALIISGQVFCFLVLQALSVYLAGNAGLTFVVPASIATMFAFGLYFWIQFKMDSPHAGKFAMGMKFVGPFACICMNYFKFQDDE
jgi:hypothetical protein